MTYNFLEGFPVPIWDTRHGFTFAEIWKIDHGARVFLIRGGGNIFVKMFDHKSEAEKFADRFGANRIVEFDIIDGADIPLAPMAVGFIRGGWQWTDDCEFANDGRIINNSETITYADME